MEYVANGISVDVMAAGNAGKVAEAYAKCMSIEKDAKEDNKKSIMDRLGNPT